MSEPMAAAADDDAGALAAVAAAAVEDGPAAPAALARAPTVRNAMSPALRALYATHVSPSIGILRKMEALNRCTEKEEKAEKAMTKHVERREAIEDDMVATPNKRTKAYAQLKQRLQKVKASRIKARARQAAATLKANKALTALVKEKSKPSARRSRLFDPLAPELLEAKPEAAAAAAVPAPSAPQTSSTSSSRSGRQSKRRRAQQSAPSSPLTALLGCPSLAYQLLAFLPSPDARKLRSTCRENRPLIDPAITNVTLGSYIIPSNPVTFAARFPLILSLSLDVTSRGTNKDERTVTFFRRLAQETLLPARLTHLAIYNANRDQREHTTNVLDALLAVDWPRLTHFETDDLEHFLSRARAQASALLARLQVIGNVGPSTLPFRHFFEEADAYKAGQASNKDINAVVAAFRAGVLPQHFTLSSVMCARNRPHTTSSDLSALAEILSSGCTVHRLTLSYYSELTAAKLAPVVALMQPQAGAFQQLRSIDIYLKHPAQLAPFLSALGTVGVAPNLTSLTLAWTKVGADEQPIRDSSLIAPGAWPRLQSLSIPAAGLFDILAGPREIFTSLFLACGPRLQSLELTASHIKWKARWISVKILLDLLSVITDEAVAIPWRASLRSIALPYLNPGTSEAQRATIAQAVKDALLCLPSLTQFKPNDGGLGATVGWIEAKIAGGLTRLERVLYNFSCPENRALLLLVAWLKSEFEKDPHADRSVKVDWLRVDNPIIRQQLLEIGLPTLIIF